MQPISRFKYAAAVLALALGACSNDSNNSPAPAPPVPPAKAFATFIDSTAGLGVFSNGASSFSDATGRFEFTVGQSSAFFIGVAEKRLELGNAIVAADALISPRNFNGAQENATYNILRLLQTLDKDQNIRSGIELDLATRTAFVGAFPAIVALNFNLSEAEFDNQAALKTALLAVNRTLLSQAQAQANFSLNFAQPRSASLMLTSDDRKLVVSNRQKGTASVIEVRNAAGSDTQTLLGEVPVGREPRFVTIAQDNSRAYVTSAIDGTLTAIDLRTPVPVVLGTPINVGLEPRGIAISPTGRYAVVANSTLGSVALVDLATFTVVQRIETGGNPHAVSITNDGDADDADETVYVSRLYSEVINEARPDGFDDAKQGVVDVFGLGAAVSGNWRVRQLILNPMASGFPADRRNFCLLTRQALSAAGTVKYFNSGADGLGAGANALAKTTFCPDNSSNDISATGLIANAPQKVYPNMLNALLVRGPLLYVPNVGASPEPPVRFNVNVHGLVGVLDRFSGAEPFSLNLNNQIKAEVQPAEGVETLARVFMNDLVAADADLRGENFLFVSRGANYLLRAKRDAAGLLNIGAPNTVRLQTGNLPNGVVMTKDGKRAYTNNELSTSVSAFDLTTNATLALDINASTPPAPGTAEHFNLMGKLTFFTALGLPDSGLRSTALRDIVPLRHKGKASDSGWSSCASCHEDGHSDNVTWIFPTGPRSTIALEGSFARGNPADQRVFNWSGVQGSFTDFNNNARGIQGGKGFATSVNGTDNSAKAFNHGFVTGVSDSLDAMQSWASTIRAPQMPDANNLAGREIFQASCASCHGGPKWTKSRILYRNSATFAADPIGPQFFTAATTNPPLDSNLQVAGPQMRQLNGPAGVAPLLYLDNVGTFNAADALQIRGAGAVAGQVAQGFAPFGAAGFNSPSLLGFAFSGPWLHDGSAETVEEVFAKHKLPDGRTIEATVFNPQNRESLKQFVLSIDDQTPIMESDSDRFVRQRGN
jgi:DNA-binding beta-propeller fold protein YncE